MQGYTIETTQYNYYHTDENGFVIARSNGPRGWNYSGKWQIIGASLRHHSRRVISLNDIANGENFGQGWIHDIDHGTHRVWGGERIKRVYKTNDN